jgi:hypothetical protein
MMNDLSEIRERLKEKQDSAAEGLRNSAWLTITILLLPVVVLIASCRSTRETASLDICVLQL